MFFCLGILICRPLLSNVVVQSGGGLCSYIKHVLQHLRGWLAYAYRYKEFSRNRSRLTLVVMQKRDETLEIESAKYLLSLFVIHIVQNRQA